ncbi:MAG: hypothetical protein L0332_27650 [Chloroflexi bacterium]|nr:hypothetical protein [Chloroflexota bacterium]MCI0580739.1 hypothetical protein [Chloroflexota bacterium]MCI0650010.1 hypothetical protein [Chloroflexota bacterium]MCI0730474.1 hypothetical protein [Chloroflexota bacterium]
MHEIAGWRAWLEAFVCEQCDWSYLLPPGSPAQRCPNCFQTMLAPLEGDLSKVAYNRPPELVIPARLPPELLQQRLHDFTRGIPFAPRDLTAANLHGRMRQGYLPLWLVDGDVGALWQAEAGFNYQVVSHQDRYAQGGWASQEVKEARIRWEPRLGRLARRYHNLPAPALEEEASLARRLGAYQLPAAVAYEPSLLSESFVRLPNRPPDNAWPDAIPSFQATAAQECQQAAGADHWREFRWSPEYGNLNWTQLLRPVYTTYYLADAGRPVVVLINGQTGQVSGPRRASMKRARWATLLILGLAVVIAVFSLLLALVSILEPRLLTASGAGLVLAMAIGLLAFLPLIIAWQFNHRS